MRLLSNSAKGEIEVGCFVTVVREAESRENGWSNTWVPPMSDMIRKVLQVEEIIKGGSCRQMLLGGRFYYPEFVLEIV